MYNNFIKKLRVSDKKKVLQKFEKSEVSSWSWFTLNIINFLMLEPEAIKIHVISNAEYLMLTCKLDFDKVLPTAI